MFSVLSHKTYRHLFSAQMIALVGTGLTTVALGLLAFDLAGKEAGAVLGTALMIKMIAYVGLSPIMGAIVERLPRRLILVKLNLLRGAVVLFLPFVTEVWQIYVLIFLMQAASAAYTPAFQAVIPEILPDEEDYTNALSLSRLAYDLENLVSPMLAATLLTLMSFDNLFFGTVIAFIISAALVFATRLPPPVKAKGRKKEEAFISRATKGIRLYLATPRLRGLFAINLAVAAAGAMVIVNTVVYVQGSFSLSEQKTAFALAAFGGGSMVAAFLLPHILGKTSDRTAMLAACLVLFMGVASTSLMQSYMFLLVLWGVLGFAYAVAQVPSGRLLKRSSGSDERPSLFTAQFALSHLCWLFTYPIAGWVGASYGLSTAALILAAIGLAGCITAHLAWPRKIL